MKWQTSRCCAVCDRAVEEREPTYLLCSHPGSLRLRVYRWDGDPAIATGDRLACQPGHVMEMAALWMATGSLSLTFARTICEPVRGPAQAAELKGNRRPDFASGKTRSNLIGELAIHPLAMEDHSPATADRLETGLNALKEAMERMEQQDPSRPPAPARFSQSECA